MPNQPLTNAERNKTRFGALIRRYRKRVGWSQEVLADRADVSVYTIRDMEKGVAAEQSARQAIHALHDKRAFTIAERQELASTFLFPNEEGSARGVYNTVGLFVSNPDRAVWRTLVQEIATIALEKNLFVATHAHGNEFSREALP